MRAGAGGALSSRVSLGAAGASGERTQTLRARAGVALSGRVLPGALKARTLDRGYCTSFRPGFWPRGFW